MAFAMYVPRMLETFIFSPPADPQVLCQLLGNLHEWLRHKLHVHRIVLRPVVIVLGHSVRRADNRVALLRRAVFIVRRFKTSLSPGCASAADAANSRPDSPSARSIPGSGPSANALSGAKIRPTPSGFMMNGPMCSAGLESTLKSGTSFPTHFCVDFAPPDLPPRSIPRLAFQSCRKRGCTARAGSLARTTPNSGALPCPTDRSRPAASSGCLLRCTRRCKSSYRKKSFRRPSTTRTQAIAVPPSTVASLRDLPCPQTSCH